jgi:hypothetical protein
MPHEGRPHVGSRFQRPARELEVAGGTPASIRMGGPFGAEMERFETIDRFLGPPGRVRPGTGANNFFGNVGTGIGTGFDVLQRGASTDRHAGLSEGEIGSVAGAIKKGLASPGFVGTEQPPGTLQTSGTYQAGTGDDGLSWTSNFDQPGFAAGLSGLETANLQGPGGFTAAGSVLEDTGEPEIVVGDAMGPEPSIITQMVNGLANEIDKDFVSNWLRTVIPDYAEVGLVGEDENGDIVVFDRNGQEIARLGSDMARFGDGPESIANQFELERLNLDRQIQNAENAFRQIEGAQEARIAEMQDENVQDRIDADVEIAQGNWDNAITIQDRMDERERLQRQLTRDLEDARLELENRSIEIDRARLDMDRQRFAMEVAVSPANLITLANMSRGFPAGQGELPGGFQRIGQAGAFGADFGTGPFRAAPTVARPEVGGQPVQAEPAPAEIDAAPSAPIGGFAEGDPNPAGGTVEQPSIPLPPGLAAAFAGQLPSSSFGAPQLPPGSVPPLSDQQLAQLTPLEKLFYQDLIRLQGQRPEDYEAIRGVATPFQVPTSQVA